MHLPNMNFSFHTLASSVVFSVTIVLLISGCSHPQSMNNNPAVGSQPQLSTQYELDTFCRKSPEQKVNETFAQSIRQFDLIFVGTVSNIEMSKPNRTVANRCWVHFHVDEWLKGQPNTNQHTIIVEATYPYQGNCQFEVGKQYVIPAFIDKGSTEQKPLFSPACFPILETKNTYGLIGTIKYAITNE